MRLSGNAGWDCLELGHAHTGPDLKVMHVACPSQPSVTVTKPLAKSNSRTRGFISVHSLSPSTREGRAGIWR